MVVVEGVRAGDEITRWIMDQDKTLRTKVLNDVPIGHKIAIRDLKNNDTVIKYGTDIGRTIAPEPSSASICTCVNVKTKRW